MNKTKLPAVIAIALPLIALGALGGCGGSSPTNTGVKGNVVLIDTPDNGMTQVSLIAAGGTAAAATVMTDAMGVFHFDKLDAGAYRLHAEHDGYAALERDGILVSDSNNGEQNLGNLVMTRLYIAGNGSAVTPGDGSPDGKKRIFTIDGVFQIYDQDSGMLTPLQTDFPFTGGLFTVDDQYLLAKVPSVAQAAAADMGVDMAMGGSCGDGTCPPAPVTPPPVFALYVVPLAGGAPWPVSFQAITAGVAANGQFGFVVVPASSGDPTAADLYTFELGATPTEPKLVGAELPLQYLTLVRDTTYAGNFGLYTQVVFIHDPVQTGWALAYDWSILDVATGTASTLLSTVDDAVCDPSDDPTQPATCVLGHHTGDAALEQNDEDVYVYRIGAPAPLHVGNLQNRGGDFLPQTPGLLHIPGYYIFDTRNAPEAGTDVYLVNNGATLAVQPLGRFAGTINNAHLGDYDPDATHAWNIRIEAGVAELVVTDLLTGATTVVQSGLTNILTGQPLDATATLGDPNVAQILAHPLSTAQGLVVNTVANGTTFTPVYVDLAGAHPLPSAPLAVWGNFSTSQDGKLLVFQDVANGAGYATVGAGALTVSRVAGTSGVANLLARASVDGNAVAYAIPNAGGFLYHLVDVATGTDVGMTTGATSFSASDLIATAKMVVGADSGGNTQIFSTAVANAAPFGPALPVLPFAVARAATANGERLVLFATPNTTQLIEVVAGAGAATYTTTSNVSAVYTFPSAQRYLLQVSGQMTIVDQDGTTTMQSGQFYPLHDYPFYSFARSPDGERVFFREGFSEDLVSFGSTGAPITTGLLLGDDSSTYLRTLGTSLVAVMQDPMLNLPQLVGIDRSTGVTTVLSTTILGSSFANTAVPATQPWQSFDEKTVYYFERVAADPMTMTPAKLRLSAYQGVTRVTLGDGAQDLPLPMADAAGNLELRTAIDSLHGTATIVDVAVGTVVPVTVATGVRSSQLSPAGTSRAVVVFDGNTLSLQSGAASGPLVSMGAVEFFDLANNLAWGEQRLYVIDREPSTTTGGTLYTGGVGEAGLTKIARDVLGVFPDKTGAQAAVIALDPSGKGVDIGRFTLATLGM